MNIMKHVLSIFLLLLFVPSCIVKEEQKNSVEEEHKNTVEDSVRINSVIFPTVIFRYAEKVNGYTVSGIFTPFDNKCETGNVILKFESPEETYTYTNPIDCVYTNKDIMDLVHNVGFKGFENNEEYTFHYLKPNSSENKAGSFPVDALHPLGYNTPFQFLDVDFDGEKELLVSDWGRSHGGNRYTAFDLKDGELIPLEGMPFDEICNMDKIDRNRKTITRIYEDGVFEYVEFCYSIKRSQTAQKPIPDFLSGMSETLMQKTIHPKFQLVSVYEKVNGKEARYKQN